MCSMKVPLIDYKLLPLALHKSPQELAAKRKKEEVCVCVKELP